MTIAMTFPAADALRAIAAPAHLCGRMNHGTSWRLRAARRDWIVAAMASGETYTTCGAALGITPAAVWLAVNKPAPEGKPCRRGAVVYPSRTAAAEALGVTRSTVNYHLRTHGHLDQVGSTCPSPCIVRGARYDSQKEAAKAHGVTPSVVATLLARHGHLDSLGMGNRGINGKSRQTVVMGHAFPSRAAAARALGMSRTQFYRCLRETANPHFQDLLIGAVMRLDARKGQTMRKAA